MAIAVVPADAGARYETQPPFCERHTVHNYLPPFGRVPFARPPNPSGKLGFGPSNVRFTALPQLLIGKGEIGFELSRDHAGPLARFNWKVRAIGARVHLLDGSTLIEKRWEFQKRVHTVGRSHPVKLAFPVGSSPALYRIDVTFQNGGDEQLASFGAYFRVVPRTRHARLGLNATSYRPGDVVFGRVENFGTETAFYGVPYAIERFDGSAWAIAPESPRGPSILLLLNSPPGQTGDQCSTFPIPPTMPPGRYRMSKDVGYGVPFARDLHEATLTAEFELTP
jgi:Bacterial Ig-like domain